MAIRSVCATAFTLLVLAIPGCGAAEESLACIDDDGAAIACEVLTDDSTTNDGVASTGETASHAGIDDEEATGAITNTREVELDADFLGELRGGGAPPGTEIAAGKTDRAELRKFLPVGKTAGVTRFVILQLRPSDLPKLASGDMLRTAAEVQLTTRCDIGQNAPGCGYSPHVRLQLLLTGNADGTNPNGAGTIALSDVKKFDCTSNLHHCLEAIDFQKASKRLSANGSPPCVASDSCFVNLVAWAYHDNARSGGQDKLIIGANEGNFLDNGKTEQDRSRIMAVRERGVSASDVKLHVTDHNVKKGSIALSSGQHEKAIYLHALNGGRDLRKGEKFRVSAEVHATANNRVNLRLEMFLTKKKNDDNGGKVAGLEPGGISEHNGTNCTPNNDCRIQKVAVFEAREDVRGPVFVDIAAFTEVPGPGSATTTIKDDGFVKVVSYAR